MAESYTIASAGDYGVAGMMKIPPDAKAMGAPPCWTGYIWVPTSTQARRS